MSTFSNGRKRGGRSDPRADRERALAKQKALIAKMLDVKMTTASSSLSLPLPAAKVAVLPQPTELTPSARVLFGHAQVPLYDRSIPDIALGVQPWAKTLTAIALDAV